MDAMSLDALQSISRPAYEQRVEQSDRGPGSKGSFRLEALREAAIGTGARGGLAYRTGLINKALQQVSRRLDVVYDFGPLMIQGRVIPPVLTEMREIYTQGDSTNLRLAGRSYKVESQARFSSRPPNWREYIFVEYPEFRLPSPELMPRNSEEQAVWKKAVADGWKKGTAQADLIFSTNLNRLNRDYTGMVRYHVLALKRMVTLPVVAQQNMPINGSGDTMSLDETLLRITAMPEFNRDMREWSPLVNEVEAIPRGKTEQKEAAREAPAPELPPPSSTETKVKG